jgi:hypothetical protein
MSRGAAKRTHQENKTLLDQLWKANGVVFLSFVILRLILKYPLMDISLLFVQGGVIGCFFLLNRFADPVRDPAGNIIDVHALNEHWLTDMVLDYGNHCCSHC